MGQYAQKSLGILTIIKNALAINMGLITIRLSHHGTSYRVPSAKCISHPVRIIETGHTELKRNFFIISSFNRRENGIRCKSFSFGNGDILKMPIHLTYCGEIYTFSFWDKSIFCTWGICIYFLKYLFWSIMRLSTKTVLRQKQLL